MIECVHSQLAATLATLKSALTSFLEERWKDA